jgi:hypothetical protein
MDRKILYLILCNELNKKMLKYVSQEAHLVIFLKKILINKLN